MVFDVEDALNRFCATPLRKADVDIVHRQLSRMPRGMVAVGARCV